MIYNTHFNLSDTLEQLDPQGYDVFTVKVNQWLEEKDICGIAPEGKRKSYHVNSLLSKFKCWLEEKNDLTFSKMKNPVFFTFFDTVLFMVLLDPSNKNRVMSYS